MYTKKVKRFFDVADVARAEEGFQVVLDDRPLRTPEGSPVVVPTENLARLVADEWGRQVEEIKPLTMPVMRLVCTALDKVIPVREQVIEQICRYGENDLLCYRSQGPDDLVAHQHRNWQPVLDWLDRRHGISLKVTQGIVHVAQPEGTRRKLRVILSGYEDFQLTGLAELTQLTGSLVLAMSFLDKNLTEEQVFLASQLDDDWQADKWGEDSEALQRRKNLQADISAVALYLTALE